MFNTKQRSLEENISTENDEYVRSDNRKTFGKLNKKPVSPKGRLIDIGKEVYYTSAVAKHHSQYAQSESESNFHWYYIRMKRK